MEALPFVTFYIGPSPTCYPPPGPLGPPWKLPRTIFILHLRRSIRTTCITLLFYFNWIWRRSLKFAKFCPWGPPPGPPWWPPVPYEHLWIPSPWGWFLPSLVKIQPCISSSSRWTVTFYIGPPPQPVTHMGAIGATLEVPPTTFILHLTTLYTTWLQVLLKLDLEKEVEICKVLALGALPLGPP